MRSPVYMALLGLLSACAAVPPTAQGSPASSTTATVQRGAVSGEKQKIAHYIQVTPGCESTGYAVVRVVTPPAHGRVSLEQGEDYPSYNKDNVRYPCDLKKVPGMLVFYTSDPGYVGA